MSAELVVGLRPMLSADLDDLLRWLHADAVQKWFVGAPVDRSGIAEKYEPRLDQSHPIDMWVVEANGRSVGFIQDYRLSELPEHSLPSPDPHARGLDFAIGESAWLGRGVGRAMLQNWCDQTAQRHPHCQTAFAAPDHRNTGSRRLLIGVGFTEQVWFDQPRPDGSVATLVACSRAL